MSYRRDFLKACVSWFTVTATGLLTFSVGMVKGKKLIDKRNGIDWHSPDDQMPSQSDIDDRTYFLVATGRAPTVVNARYNGNEWLRFEGWEVVHVFAWAELPGPPQEMCATWQDYPPASACPECGVTLVRSTGGLLPCSKCSMGDKWRDYRDDQILKFAVNKTLS